MACSRLCQNTDIHMYNIGPTGEVHYIFSTAGSTKKKPYHQNDPSKVSTAFICSSLWTESSLGEHR